MKPINTIAKDLGNTYIHGDIVRKIVHKGLCYYSKLSHKRIEKVYYLISEDKKYIFLINPLVASQSMTAGLKDNALKENYNVSFNSHKITLEPKTDFYNFHRFCIVRNPWERVVSCFHKKITNANTTLKLLLISRHPEINLGMCFEEFVDFLCGQHGTDENSDSHWMSQSYLLSDTFKKPLWDHYYKLENFPDSMYDAVHSAGIQNFQIPMIGSSVQMKTKRKKDDYRAYFNDETWDKIAIRYRRDIEIFGYQQMV